MDVTLKDFQPVNRWKPDLDGEKFTCCPEHRGQARFIIDETTNRRYSNDSPGTVRLKCFLLTLGTPFVHPLVSIANVGYRVLRLVSFANFWAQNEKETKYNFKARLANAGKDLLRIVATPFALLGLQLAAVYGLFRPYDGRKLYATIERATYGNFILAPCFQPDPKFHAFGGDMNKKDAF